MPSHYPNHDQLFGIAMRNIAVAKDLLRNSLPPAICQRLAIDHLQLLPNNFFGRVHKHFVDAIYQVPLLDQQGQLTDQAAFIILLPEHKASPDRWAPLQILRYMTEIWSDWLDKQQREKKPVKHLPPIWPLIIYHGKKSPYPESTDIRDLFEDRSLAESMLNEPFQLIDLTQVSDEEIKKQGMAASFQLLQKHIWEQGNWPFVEELLNLIRPVAHLLGDDLLMAMLKYMANYGKIDDKARFEQLVVKELPGYEEKFMTIAQQWREEGKQQGMQQGMQEYQKVTARRMLAKGQKKGFISEITGLTIEEIEVLLDDGKQ